MIIHVPVPTSSFSSRTSPNVNETQRVHADNERIFLSLRNNTKGRKKKKKEEERQKKKKKNVGGIK